jgi:hypothetical protein
MPLDPVCGMEVSEEAASRLTYQGKIYFFCNLRCREKFIKENKIVQAEISTCQVSSSRRPFYRNKAFIVATILVGLVLLSYIIPQLVPFRKTLEVYFKTIWWAILLGFFMGGIIDHYVPREYISCILAGSGKKTIFYSVILGFFMSACSHGILALSIQLYKKGASGPAVVAFLLASPWANLTLTIVLVGFFGLKAFFIIFSAVIIALITGFIFQILEKKNLIEKNKNIAKVEEGFSIVEDIRKRAKEYKFSLETLKSDIKGIWEGMVSLSNMVLWWLLIGIGLASLAGAYIPSAIFESFMGPTLLGLFVTLIVATIMEVCSEGTAPMSFEIFRQTGALGNSFVFLMAGVVTDYTEIGLLWHNVGPKTAIWLPIITVPQVILLGFIANVIF